MAEPARRDPCLGSRPDASPLPPTSETRRSEVRHRNKGQPRRALRSLLISPGCTPHEASQNFNSKRSRGPRPFPVMLCGRACATQPAWRGTFLRREGGRLRAPTTAWGLMLEGISRRQQILGAWKLGLRRDWLWAQAGQGEFLDLRDVSSGNFC